MTCAKCGRLERLSYHHYCSPCKKETDHNDYIKHKKARLLACKTYYQENRYLVLERRVGYNEAHRKEAVERAKRWAVLNPEKVKKNKQLWRERHPEHSLALTRKRQCAKLQRTPKFGQDGIINFYINCPDGMVVDHIIPLQGKTVSGLHVVWNLQYLTPTENSRKGNKYGE